MVRCFSQNSFKLDIPIFPVLFPMYPRTYLYACMCICIGKTSSLPSITLRMQSLPGGADLHLYFFRTTFSIAILRKTEKANLFLFVWILWEHSWMKKWMNFTTYISTVKTHGSSQGCVLRRSMVNYTLGDDCLLRMRAIIPLLLMWELGVF